MANKLVFNGISSEDIGIGISGSGTYVKPRRRVEHYKVPGRNGELTVSDGSYENINLVYECYAFNDFPIKMDALASWLLSTSGYARLEDTYHPNHYRLAEFVGPIEPTPTTLNMHGTFKLEFNCRPEKFLKSGEFFYKLGENREIFNPTAFCAKPLIKIDYAAWSMFAIVGKHNRKSVDNTLFIQPYDSNEPLYLDCETYEAYYIDENNHKIRVNSAVQLTGGEYPIISPGKNTIDFTDIDDWTSKRTGNIDIQYRWWEL